MKTEKKKTGLATASVPDHLRGSRQAIFYLLRQVQTPKDPMPVGKVVRPVKTRTAEIATLGPGGSKSHPCSAGMRFLFQEDQFVFQSSDLVDATILGGP